TRLFVRVIFMLVFFLFFFQAEDGIRDFHVTGVQTCALPISGCRRGLAAGAADVIVAPYSAAVAGLNPAAAACGRECNHESSSAAAAPGNGWPASGLCWPVSDGYGIRHRG